MRVVKKISRGNMLHTRRAMLSITIRLGPRARTVNLAHSVTAILSAQNDVEKVLHDCGRLSPSLPPQGAYVLPIGTTRLQLGSLVCVVQRLAFLHDSQRPPQAL